MLLLQRFNLPYPTRWVFDRGLPDLKAHFSFRAMSWPVPRQAPVSLPYEYKCVCAFCRVSNSIHHTYPLALASASIPLEFPIDHALQGWHVEIHSGGGFLEGAIMAAESRIDILANEIAPLGRSCITMLAIVRIDMSGRSKNLVRHLLIRETAWER